MQITAVVAMFSGLPEQELTGWIERGWVQPETSESGWVFHDIDVARIRLVYDLRRAMEIDEETIPLVLSLLDQIYDLRARLKSMVRAVETQPEAVRVAIRAAMGG